MKDILLQGLAYAVPSLITGGVAYFFFSAFLRHDDNEKKFQILSEKKKESLPIKLQAYERLVLFSERINPTKLIMRVKPVNNDIASYLHLLVGNIEQEFEHNLVQQLYVSEESWTAVIAAKLAIINNLKDLSEKYETAGEFREKSLIDLAKKESASETAIAFLKQEVKKLI